MFETLKSNLEKKGYGVSVFATGDEAVEYLVGAITETTVAFGGSTTLDQLGLYERLAVKNDVRWHWRVPEGSNARAVLKSARDASVYLASANALAETGEIVNIDGNGNRVAETCFGHERVYFVVGRNKIVPTLADALDRARNVAAPLNARRLAPSAPNFDVARICRVTTVFEAAPLMAKYEVVLVDQELGF